MRSGLPLLVVVIFTGCGGASESSSEPPAAAESQGDEAVATPAATTADAMWHHFLDATEARDAVIGGKLAAVRVPLTRLAEAGEEGEIAADWVPWVEEMKAEARRGAQSATIEEAAASVASLGSSCGECHRTTRGGPDWTGDEGGYRHMGKTGLKEKMGRHLWAAEELWLGLTGPVHQAWSRGAAALMNINVPSLVTHRGTPATSDRRPSGEGELQGEVDPEMPGQEGRAQGESDDAADTVDLDVALRELRELGRRADQATIAKDKQAVFAEVLTRCGACHQRLGIQVD